MKKILLFSTFSFYKLKLKRYNLMCADCTMGILFSGGLNENLLRYMLANLEDGVTKIVCHPGEKIIQEYRHWKYDWYKELCALTSPEIKELIHKLNHSCPLKVSQESILEFFVLSLGNIFLKHREDGNSKLLSKKSNRCVEKNSENESV